MTRNNPVNFHMRRKPDDWDDWPHSAKVEWMSTNRTQIQMLREIVEMVTDEDVDIRGKQGTLLSRDMAEAYVTIQEAL